MVKACGSCGRACIFQQVICVRWSGGDRGQTRLSPGIHPPNASVNTTLPTLPVLPTPPHTSSPLEHLILVLLRRTCFPPFLPPSLCRPSLQHLRPARRGLSVRTRPSPGINIEVLSLPQLFSLLCGSPLNVLSFSRRQRRAPRVRGVQRPAGALRPVPAGGGGPGVPLRPVGGAPAAQPSSVYLVQVPRHQGQGQAVSVTDVMFVQPLAPESAGLALGALPFANSPRAPG